MTSLFKVSNETPQEQGNVEEQTITSYVDLLVGEGKKFKDLEALARGKYESDNEFVPQLLKEKRDLEAELQTRMSLEEFLTRNEAPVSTPPVTPAAGTPPVSVNAQTISPDDIQKLINETLTKEQTKALQANNISQTQKELQKLWGSEYLSKLQRKSSELGLDEKAVNSLAANNPKAFMAMMGAPSAPSFNPNASLPPVTNRSVNETSNGKRNAAYYNNLKKNNPKEYFSAKVVAQRHKDALELREAFFTD